MKGKIRLFFISNLVAAGLLAAGCAQTPPEEVVEPGAGESTQLEATAQVEEPVAAEATQETIGETESLAGAEATTEAAGETEDVAGVETTTEAATETGDIAGTQATSEAAGETEDVAGVEATTEAAGETEAIAGAEATTEAAAETQDVAAQATQTVGEAESESAFAAKASVLVGQAIQGPQGEALARVEDLVIGVESNQVKYVVVSLGDLLNMENQLFFIPANVFRFDPEQNTFVLDATAEQLLNIPNFEAAQWPDLNNPDWEAELQAFWQNNPLNATGTTQQQDQDMARNAAGETAVRASEILASTIQNSQGEQVGQVENIVVQLDTGHVQYVVLSLDDEIDNSDEFVGIQMSELAFNPENDAFIFDADQSLIQNAPSFTPDEWNDQFNLVLGQIAQ